MNFEFSQTAAAADLSEALGRQNPDGCLAAIDGGKRIARCSLWWKNVPELPDERIGCIGHFDCEQESAGSALAIEATGRLRDAGCTLAIGPMDGNTWRNYRFVTEGRDEHPPFFLEPWNPADFPEFFRAAGFETLATYSSSLVHLDAEAGRSFDRIEARLASRKMTIRPIDSHRFREELDDLYDLCLDAFIENFLYTPIEREEFLTIYGQIEEAVIPEFVLIAESAKGDPAGFVFCLPDLLDPEKKGLIVKTLAVHPRWRSLGLGSVLVHRAQTAARERGFRHAIHALQHQNNQSLKITGRDQGRKIREYGLFSKRLEAR